MPRAERRKLAEFERRIDIVPGGNRRPRGRVTRRVDFALFMVEALENDELVHEAAIVGRQSPSALAHAAGG